MNPYSVRYHRGIPKHHLYRYFRDLRSGKQHPGKCLYINTTIAYTNTSTIVLYVINYLGDYGNKNILDLLFMNIIVTCANDIISFINNIAHYVNIILNLLYMDNIVVDANGIIAFINNIILGTLFIYDIIKLFYVSVMCCCYICSIVLQVFTYYFTVPYNCPCMMASYEPMAYLASNFCLFFFFQESVDILVTQIVVRCIRQ